MTDDPRWRRLDSGELVHIRDDLTVDSQMLFSAPPAHQVTLDDLAPNAATSQQPTP